MRSIVLSLPLWLVFHGKCFCADIIKAAKTRLYGHEAFHPVYTTKLPLSLMLCTYTCECASYRPIQGILTEGEDSVQLTS
jgi:hypothetical protein